MDCKKCGAKMYVRTAKNVPNSSVIYICSKCDAAVFVWPDGEMKEGSSGRQELKSDKKKQ